MLLWKPTTPRMFCGNERGSTETAEPQPRISPDSDAVSLPNTCCLHFEFRYLCSVDRVDRVYALGLHGHWLAVGTRASNRTLPTPLTPSSTCHSASSGHHRGNRPTPGSPRSNLQLRPLLLRLSIDAWVPPLELFAHKADMQTVYSSYEIHISIGTTIQRKALG